MLTGPKDIPGYVGADVIAMGDAQTGTSLPVKGGQVLWKGAAVGTDESGNAWPMQPGKRLKIRGIARYTADARSAGDGEVNVKVIVPDVAVMPCAADVFASSWAGAPVYSVDDETVSPDDDCGARPYFGALDALKSATSARVRIGPEDGGMLIRRARRVAFGDFTAAATSQAFDIGLELPLEARFRCAEIACPTLFSGGAISAFVLDIGDAGTPTGLINGMDVFTGATGFPKFGDAGAWFAGAGHAPQLGGKQLKIRLRATGANVTAATAGVVEVRLMFTRER